MHACAGLSPSPGSSRPKEERVDASVDVAAAAVGRLQSTRKDTHTTTRLLGKMFHDITKKELIEEERKEELMQTGVLCCCFLAFRCCSAVVLITRSQSIVPSPRYAMPCHARPFHPFFIQWWTPSSSVSSSPFPSMPAWYPPTPMPKMPPTAPLFVTKEKKRQDAAAAAAVDEGSDAVHAPPCSKPGQRKKRHKKPMVELSHAMQCDAFARCGSPQTCLP